ncbi:RNA polymerase sigma-70 factor [Mucilaginibacter sp. KACC 22063]|uniref:RNA polymerase sigma-70 factor n=1 Tax=Mucilaginibacter sp. KACC 22063 TaxID=3025666 RepID=UPI002367182E|nr:RNA polymerase sigma-70 factor [Mucilaginibacter sp. KACC 22063]WDF57356.1 RNA polymerase sigma-70 factor [Mucilaginibacter sp. KACC 22063]
MPAEKDLFVNKLTAYDKAAFESLFKIYYRKLILFANRFVNDLDVSEEIVCDVFAVLWEKGHEINFTGTLSSYLFKAVQNRCLNHLKHKKIENLYVSYLERNHLLNEIIETTESRYFEKEMSRQITTALDALPEKCREIFVMSRFGNKKYKEIAEELNLSPKTVERQISIALDKMRKLLKHLSIILF